MKIGKLLRKITAFVFFIFYYFCTVSLLFWNQLSLTTTGTAFCRSVLPCGVSAMKQKYNSFLFLPAPGWRYLSHKQGLKGFERVGKNKKKREFASFFVVSLLQSLLEREIQRYV